MSPPIGSVVEGTLRHQDLIPKFLQVLRELNPELHIRWVTPGTPDYLELPKEDDNLWWSSDEALKALNDLVEALDDLSPPKCYFGPHFGNSSDFGFWPL